MHFMIRLINPSNVKFVIFRMKTPDFLPFLKFLSYISAANFFLLLGEFFRRCFWDFNVFRRKFFPEF